MAYKQSYPPLRVQKRNWTEMPYPGEDAESTSVCLLYISRDLVNEAAAER